MRDRTNILVVDDDPIIRISAERVLCAEGYDVDSVQSAEEAMHRIERNCYDLLLTDLNMLEAGGIDLIQWIKGFRPAIGVVVITGNLLQETIKKALTLGINEHGVRPCVPTELKKAINMTTAWVRGNTPGTGRAEEFSPEKIRELDRIIASHRGVPGSTIPVLLKAQEILGYIPPVIQERIAQGLNKYLSEVRSIVSFYSGFRTGPAGKHTIKVCRGSSCHKKGSEKVLKGIRNALQVDIGETTKNRRFTLETVRCTGNCKTAPVMVVDQEKCDSLTQDKALEFINSFSPEGAPPPPEGSAVA